MKKFLKLFFILMGLCVVVYNIVLIFLFDKIYPEKTNIDLIGEIISLPEHKNNSNKYLLKTIANPNIKYSKNTKLIIYVKKEIELLPGDIVYIKGDFSKPEQAKNYKGFNYRNYLKQFKIYGSVKTSKVTFIKKNIDLYRIFGFFKNKIVTSINSLYSEDYNEFLKGILLGDDSNLSDNIKNSFRESSLSHILAISGMHISYLIIGLKIVLERIINDKRKSNYILIFLLFGYLSITGFQVSCLRACIMASVAILSSNMYRKNNFYISILTSFIIIVLINPFNIISIGMWLSYLATLGIVVFSKFVRRVIEIKLLTKNKSYRIIKHIINLFSISFSAQIFIFPIMIYIFNTYSLTFFISNILISVFIGPILVIGYISILVSFVFYPFAKLLVIIEKILIKIIFIIASICSKVPLSNIIITPQVGFVVLYYIIIIYIIYKIKKEKVNFFRFLLKFPSISFNKIRTIKKKKYISFFSIIVIIFSFIDYSGRYNYLRINFIDVGQGDCTFIQTPKGKSILIDGGDAGEDKYDYGKNVVVPYLLDRRYKKIDYIIISHFDSDHVGGLLTVMEELKVGQVIISKQGENSENYEKFKKIVKNKKIKITVVEKGNKLKIEKNLYLDFLWPNNEKLVRENVLNNNSVVCKLNYRNISMLFTGDIEEIAEKQILEEYKNNFEILNSTVLKVAHHGSKTSSTKEFIEKVKPNIALIGVGENNKFGHPNNDILERLKKNGTKIYRTDQMGEINIIIDQKGIINVKQMRQNKYNNSYNFMID